MFLTLSSFEACPFPSSDEKSMSFFRQYLFKIIACLTFASLKKSYCSCVSIQETISFDLPLSLEIRIRSFPVRRVYPFFSAQFLSSTSYSFFQVLSRTFFRSAARLAASSPRVLSASYNASTAFCAAVLSDFVERFFLTPLSPRAILGSAGAT